MFFFLSFFLLEFSLGWGICATCLICHVCLLPHTHVTQFKEPHNGRVTEECYVPANDELSFFSLSRPSTRWFSAFIVSIPIEDRLKFHSVIPTTQTLVSPIDAAQCATRQWQGIRKIWNNECFHSTGENQESCSWSQTVKVTTDLQGWLIALTFLSIFCCQPDLWLCSLRLALPSNTVFSGLTPILGWRILQKDLCRNLSQKLVIFGALHYLKVCFSTCPDSLGTIFQRHIFKTQSRWWDETWHIVCLVFSIACFEYFVLGITLCHHSLCNQGCRCLFLAALLVCV